MIFFHSFSIGNEYIQTQCKTHYKNILKIGDIDRDGVFFPFIIGNLYFTMQYFINFFSTMVT